MELEGGFVQILRFTLIRVLMYRNYFGLKEKPFSITPDPRYLYMSELHRGALDHLLYGVSSEGCFILLTGDVGTGKTTVSRCLLTQLPDNTDVALVADPRLTVLELLQAICNELSIALDGTEKDLDSYIDKINHFLGDAHGRGRNITLIIDEAQNLSLDLLEQLCLLTDFEADNKKLLTVILLGQTELRQILNQEGAAEINQRIAASYHLLPLDRENSFAYIKHRLAVAGEPGEIFSPKALDRVFELSGGIPRLMNVLCDRALLGTYEEKKYLVTADIVERASQEVLGDIAGTKKQGTPIRFWYKLVSGAAVIALAAGGVVYYSGNRTPVADIPGSKKLLAEMKIVKAVNKENEHETATGKQPLTKQKEKSARATIRIVPLKISD